MSQRSRLSCLASVVLLAACSGTGGGAAGATATPGAGGGSTTAPAGNGGGSPGAAGGPCALLTSAEVSAAVGQVVGVGNNDQDPNKCDFQYPADGIPKIQASITIEKGSTFDDLCGPGSAAAGITVTTLTGIGDNACFTAVSDLPIGDSLTFTKGGQVYSTNVALGQNATLDQIEAADKALALAALTRL